MMLLRKEILALSLMFITLPALAAIQPKVQSAPEVYEATEAEVDAAPGAKPAMLRVAPRQAAGIARPQPVIVQPVQALPTPAAVAANGTAPDKLPDSGLSYDPVPSDQINALGRRLQLVDALIRRHGRAYDYRTHTVRDLELILAKLDASLTSSR